MELLKLQFSQLLSLELESLSYYKAVGLSLVPRNIYKANDIIDWKYGDVKEMQGYFSVAMSLDEIPQVLSLSCSKTVSQLEKAYWINVFEYYNYIKAEVLRTVKLEETDLSYEPEADELAAGIERYNQFGIVVSIDRIAGGDVTKWEAITEMPYRMIHTKLKLLKIDTEYQKALTRIKMNKKLN